MKELRIANVSKRIKKKKILDNVSIQISEGTIHGLIGENGAGSRNAVKSIHNICMFRAYPK